jgi:hypothetical protein
MKKLNNFQKIAVLIFVLTIFILSTLFHFPVHITDALTLEAVPDFDIHISFWRIVFEPIMGILTFFNRSVYAIKENEYVLYWVLIFFIIYSLWRYLKFTDKKEKKKFVISQLVNFPIVIGLWFTYFVIILFLSRFFPANTIVNNSPDTILVTTHSHTVFSHDGLVSQEGQWKWHKYNNFDAFFITDHNNHGKTLDFVNAQRRGEFPVEPLVMCGEEFSGTNHLSLLGLKRNFNTKKYSDARAIDSVRANGGVVIVNHWFDGEKESLQFFKNLGVDGFEIENTATETSYDRSVYTRIRNFCETNNLIMNGGLDYHGYGNVCSIWNAMKIPGWHKLDPVGKEEAILNVIRSHDQSKLKVLLYTDRPFYTPDYLFFRPIITFFNYFRTLNMYQVLSWIFWISLVFFIRTSGFKDPKNKCSVNRIIPLLGISGAVFMLILGGVYYAKISELAGTTNDIFEEYSTILFCVGSVFLFYSFLVALFRFKKEKVKN